MNVPAAWPTWMEDTKAKSEKYGGESLAQHTWDVLAKLAEVGIPAGKVRSMDEVYDWDQVASQHLLLEVDHPVLGEITIPGSPIRLDDNAFSGGREVHLPPPGLGEHSDAVRAWLDEDRADG